MSGSDAATEPHDIAAEQAVLGSMMMSADVIGDVSAIVTSADYYRPHHQIAHEVITGLHNQGATVDPISVAAELRRRGDLKSGALDAPYLHTLLAAGLPKSATQHATIVRACADRRDLVAQAERLRQAAPDPGKDPAVVRARAIDALAARKRPDQQAAEQPEPLPEIPRFPVDALSGPLRDFVDWGVRDGLHAECTAGAALAALVTMAGPARLRLGAKSARPILWTVVVGVASAGKSPAYEHAFATIREAYARQREEYEVRLDEDGESPKRPEPYELDDATTEAVARWLSARGTDTSGSVVDDELAAFLEGLNQYKGGQGSDVSKWLKMWTGTPLHIQRVGSGGKRNEVSLYIPEPVVSVTGPLVPGNLHLLGKPGSGFRPRWLPFYAPPVPPKWNRAGDYPKTWVGCIEALAGNRDRREWTLGGSALAEWEKARQRWNAQQSDPEPDDVIEALRKADAQALRIALVVAESGSPGAGGPVPAEAVRCAVAIVDYCVKVWRALPGNSTMLASRREDVMDTAYRRLLAWLETRPPATAGLPDGSAPRPGASRRHMGLWLHESPQKLNELIAEHRHRWPDCVVAVKPPRGPETVWLYAPPRGEMPTPLKLSRRQFAEASVRPAVTDETAGQRPPSASRETVARTTAEHGATVRRDSSRRDSSGLRMGTCPSCGVTESTVVEPGERAYCKHCDTEYTSLPDPEVRTRELLPRNSSPGGAHGDARIKTTGHSDTASQSATVAVGNSSPGDSSSAPVDGPGRAA